MTSANASGADLATIERAAQGGDPVAMFSLALRMHTDGRREEFVHWLTQAAEKGLPPARVQYGLCQLTGVSGIERNTAAAIAALQEGANGGELPAMRRLAALQANGLYTSKNWPNAMRLLGEGAALGDQNAQAQIAVLNGGVPQDWRAAAAEISVDSVRWPDRQGALSNLAGVQPILDFLPRHVCRHLIALGRPHLRAQSVYLTGGGHGVTGKRTNTGAFFVSAITDVVVAAVRERIACLFDLPTTQLEACSLLHYGVGEEFADHYDAITPDNESATEEIARIGQRTRTLISYLNDDYEGGPTEFPRIGMTNRGAPGDALAWVNVRPNGEVEPGSLHAGRAPTKGEKWVLSQWIRDRDCSASWM